VTDENKICPECRVEYLSRAQTCADCGVALIWASRKSEVILAETLAEALAEAHWDGVAPGVILGELVADHEYVIKGYLGHLKAAGIRSAVLPATRYEPRERQHTDSVVFGRTASGGGAEQVPVGTVLEGFHYILFVSREKYEQANALIDEVFESLHPGEFRGLSFEFEAGTCPACGYGVDEAAEDCPDCGLSLA
jgi:hypothetical protein